MKSATIAGPCASMAERIRFGRDPSAQRTPDLRCVALRLPRSMRP